MPLKDKVLDYRPNTAFDSVNNWLFDFSKHDMHEANLADLRPTTKHL